MTITYGQETNTTPAVEYTYDTAANGSRLLAMTYPDGRVVHDVYNSGLDSNISRLSATADDDGIGGTGTTLESYKYLGVDTVVERDQKIGQRKLLLTATNRAIAWPGSRQ